MAEEKHPQLNPARFTYAEHDYNNWSVNAEQGTTREDLKSPNFWAHVANKLRAGAEIRVLAEDGSFIARFLVIAADRTWARVHELSFIDLRAEAAPVDLEAVVDDYEVKLRGPKRWSVLRKSDRAVLQENLYTKEDADQWLKRYLENPTSVAA